MMNRLITLLLSFFRSKKTHKAPDRILEYYNIFDKKHHLQPVFDKAAFNTLRGWDFGWAVLKTINIAGNRADNAEFSKRFSPGQKALYFFWYLDAQVTNGGFIQFFWNGYREYLPPIIDGLKLINDTALLNLIYKADEEYLT